MTGDISLDEFFKRLEARDDIGAAERDALRASIDSFGHFDSQTDLVKEGDRPKRSTLLLKGFAARYKIVGNGERQISAIHISGDFIDLHSFPLKEMDHSVLALTDCEVAFFPHSELEKLTANYPHLTRMLWLMTLLDSAIHREWITGLGRLSAEARHAHLMCELGVRLEAVGHGKKDNFHLPVTQSDLADALGVSSVHENRVIQSLRAKGLLAWHNGQVTLPDLKAIYALAEFDDRYLHLVKEPR